MFIGELYMYRVYKQIDTATLNNLLFIFHISQISVNSMTDFTKYSMLLLIMVYNS